MSIFSPAESGIFSTVAARPYHPTPTQPRPTKTGDVNRTLSAMVTKSRLRLAIAAEKGVDFKKLKLAKKEKTALKRKRAVAGTSQKTDDGDLKARGKEEGEQDERTDEEGEGEGSDGDESEFEDVGRNRMPSRAFHHCYFQLTLPPSLFPPHTAESRRRQ